MTVPRLCRPLLAGPGWPYTICRDCQPKTWLSRTRAADSPAARRLLWAALAWPVKGLEGRGPQPLGGSLWPIALPTCARAETFPGQASLGRPWQAELSRRHSGPERARTSLN